MSLPGREWFEEVCSGNNVVLFPQVLSPEEQIQAASNNYNFDHPDAFDFHLLTHTLRKLKQGKSVKIPVYDFTTHGRQKDWVRWTLTLQPVVLCLYYTHLY